MKLADSLRRAQTLGMHRIDAQLLHLYALDRDANERAWLLAHAAKHVSAPALRVRISNASLAQLTGWSHLAGLVELV